jgi:hypothetical protein
MWKKSVPVQFGIPSRIYVGALSDTKKHLSQKSRVAPCLQGKVLGSHWFGPTAGLECLELRKFCAWNRTTMSVCLRSRSVNNTLYLFQIKSKDKAILVQAWTGREG